MPHDERRISPTWKKKKRNHKKSEQNCDSERRMRENIYERAMVARLGVLDVEWSQMDKPTGSHLDSFLKLPATNRRVGDNHPLLLRYCDQASLALGPREMKACRDEERVKLVRTAPPSRLLLIASESGRAGWSQVQVQVRVRKGRRG